MKREIIIRNAEKEDVRQIAEILVEDWQKAYRGIMDDAFLDSMNGIPAMRNRRKKISEMRRNYNTDPDCNQENTAPAAVRYKDLIA